MRRGRLREAVAKVMCRGEAFGWPCYAVTSGLVVLCLCVVEPINSIISIIRTRFVFKLWSLPCGFNYDLFGLKNPGQCVHYSLCCSLWLVWGSSRHCCLFPGLTLCIWVRPWRFAPASPCKAVLFVLFEVVRSVLSNTLAHSSVNTFLSHQPPLLCVIVSTQGATTGISSVCICLS